MRSATFFTLIFFLSGCSYFNLPNPFEKSVDDYSQTEIGVATGAALGAGLGAVVGSASGNAGEGLAVGTLAGAAAGGLIGDQIEKNDQLMQDQSEALIRQQEMLTVQEREIRDMQASLDQIFPNNKPSVRPNVSLDSYDGSPTARRLAQGQNTRARLDKNAIDSIDLIQDEQTRPAIVTSNQVYRISERNASSVGKTFSTPEVKKVGVVDEAQRIVEDTTNLRTPIQVSKKIEPAKEIRQVTKQTNEPIIVAKKLEVAAVAKTAEVTKKPEKTTIKTASEPENKVEKTASKPAVDPAAFDPNDLQTYDANCMQAEEEATRARQATSDADKLFYYRRALRLCATEPSYHVDIAKVYESIGRLDDARFEYNQAIQLDPDNNIANKGLAALK